MNSLAFRSYPEIRETNRQSIVILHGLFGSSKNWISICKALAEKYQVFALDLRNHGDSFHSSEHSIPAMSKDLGEFLRDQKIENPILIGHSMGGIVSMYFTLNHPQLVSSLIVEDIAPKSYPFEYQNEVSALSIDVAHCKTRTEVDHLMERFVPDTFLRQFLQMNLERKEGGGYYWKLNVSALQNSDRLFDSYFKEGLNSTNPTMFVLGGSSTYVREEDKQTIQNFFPNAQIEVIEGGGHFVHYSHSAQFLTLVFDFLSSLSL